MNIQNKNIEENITYYFSDKNNNEENNENSTDLSDLINEFEKIDMNNFDINTNKEDAIFSEIKNYELNYNIKQLLIICEYYGLTNENKKIKTMKKNDIIFLIIMFENDMKNTDLVIKRKEMWFYLEELKLDKFMKKFVIW